MDRSHTSRQETLLKGVHASADDLVRLRFAARRLQLGTARSRANALSGGHQTRFRGRGMDFAESRIYLPGDDIRTMDWRVTARSGQAHTKVYHAERERPVLLMTDLTGSMFFGSRVAFKSVIATEVAALVAWATVQDGDRIGALVFNEQEHQELKPTGGRRGALHLIRLLATLSRPTQQADTDPQSLVRALIRVRRVARPGSLLVIISDFYDLNEDAMQHLTRLREHNDLIAVWVSDPLEETVLPPGTYRLSDGQRSVHLPLNQAAARQRYQQRLQSMRSHIRTSLKTLGITSIPIRTNDDVVEALCAGFAGRQTHGYASTPGGPRP